MNKKAPKPTKPKQTKKSHTHHHKKNIYTPIISSNLEQ